MAFAGYLIKLGGSSGTELPLKYIKAEKYKVTPNQRLESEAGRAVTGLLHRTTIAQTKTKIEFDTPPIDNTQLAELNGLIFAAMTDTHRRDITIYYYDPETDSYKTANCYMPDADYSIKHLDTVNTKVFYDSVRFAFIEY